MMLKSHFIRGMWVVLAGMMLLIQPVQAQLIPNNAQSNLYQGAWDGDLEKIQSSLEAGANVFAQDVDGNTAADIAVDQGFYDIAHYLLQYGDRLRARQSEISSSTVSVPSASPPSAAPVIPVVTPPVAPSVPAPERVQKKSPPSPQYSRNPLIPDTSPFAASAQVSSGLSVMAPVSEIPKTPIIAKAITKIPAKIVEKVVEKSAEKSVEKVVQKTAQKTAPKVIKPVVESVAPSPSMPPKPIVTEVQKIELAQKPDIKVEKVSAPKTKVPKIKAPKVKVSKPLPVTEPKQPVATDVKKEVSGVKTVKKSSKVEEFFNVVSGFFSPHDPKSKDQKETENKALVDAKSKDKSATNSKQLAIVIAPMPSLKAPTKTERKVSHKDLNSALGMALGKPLPAEKPHQGQTCIIKASARAVCIETTLWSEGLFQNFDDLKISIYKRKNRGNRVIVGYKDGTAKSVQTIFPALDFLAVTDYFITRFGDPDDTKQLTAAPLGKARKINNVLVWYGYDERAKRETVLKIMNYDTTRDSFPNMDEGSIIYKYYGEPSAFTTVTPIELIRLP